MIQALPAQLRYSLSLAFGARLRPAALDRLVEGFLASRAEFGELGRDAAEALRGPDLDEETRREVHLRRFRKQARLAATTAYYGERLASSGVDPAKLRWPDVESLPPTTKEALRSRPDDFLPPTARPAFRALTTGTTGVPTTVYFSLHELDASTALNAMGLLLARQAAPGDVVQLSVSSRGLYPLIVAARSLARIGALAYQAGFVEPAHALALLADARSLPGHVRRANVLSTTPSYLGSLVERGTALGYRPRDFGLERVLLGGEIASGGLRARAERLFGTLEYVESYNATEILPVGALACGSGHLHFPIPTGLVEVLSLDRSGPARPGEAGTLVITPFAPYRETTVLLRYDTGDVVRVPAEPPECELATMPATTLLLGKRALAVRHEHGWAFQRDVVEALEAVEEVPLPARFGLWAEEDGVGVEVVARDDDGHTRRQIAGRLERSVPLRALRVVTDARALEHAVPVRADLREHSFAEFAAPEPRASAREVVPA